jgi:hypothetical protein
LTEAEEHGEHGYACPLPATAFVDDTHFFTRERLQCDGTALAKLFGLSPVPVDAHVKRLNRQSSRKSLGNR